MAWLEDFSNFITKGNFNFPKTPGAGSYLSLTNTGLIKKDIKKIENKANEAKNYFIDGFKNPDNTFLKYFRIKNYSPTNNLRFRETLPLEYQQDPIMYKKGAEIKNQSEQIKKDLLGGTLDSNQLKPIVDAALEMANIFKKQGAITEIAGEQAIAQAFQQTPEAAKMFVAAAQKQDAETILKLFTQLGIVK